MFSFNFGEWPVDDKVEELLNWDRYLMDAVFALVSQISIRPWWIWSSTTLCQRRRRIEKSDSRRRRKYAEMREWTTIIATTRRWLLMGKSNSPPLAKTASCDLPCQWTVKRSSHIFILLYIYRRKRHGRGLWGNLSQGPDVIMAYSILRGRLNVPPSRFVMTPWPTPKVNQSTFRHKKAGGTQMRKFSNNCQRCLRTEQYRQLNIINIIAVC